MEQFKQRTTIFTKIIVLFIVLIISMISISTYVSIHYESKVAKESGRLPGLLRAHVGVAEEAADRPDAAEVVREVV